MSDRRTREPSPTGRVLALPGSRRLVVVCGLLGVGVWALLVVQWALVASVVSTVATGGATGGATPAALSGTLAGVLAAWGARALLTGVRDRAAATPWRSR